MVVKAHLRLRCVASSCTSGEEAAERVSDLVSERAFLSTSSLSSACLGKLLSFVMTCSGSADATVYLCRPGAMSANRLPSTIPEIQCAGQLSLLLSSQAALCNATDRLSM